jgi:hypothetical protein
VCLLKISPPLTRKIDAPLSSWLWYRHEEMTPYTYSKITCIRSNKKQNDDDTITITPFLNIESTTEPMSYTVLHKTGLEHSPEGSQHKSVTILNAPNLLNYVSNLLDLLYYDEDPFEHIQFDLPNIPSILIRTSNLDLIRETIMSHYRSITETPCSWPFDNSVRLGSSVPNTVSEPTIKQEYVTPEPKNNKHKKNKHKNHYKPSCCTEESCPPRTLGARQHLFFDEDNSIVEEYEYPYTYTL